MGNNPFFKYLTGEDWEHIRIMNHLRAYHQDKIWWHVPSEGKRSPFERYKASLLGLVKGVPDIALMHPKFKLSVVGGQEFEELLYSALLIEVKIPDTEKFRKTGKNAGKKYTAKGVVSEAQEQMIERLNKAGYLAVVCRGSEEAIKVIEDYCKPMEEKKV